MEKIKFELIQMEKNFKTDKSIFIKDRTIFIIGRNKKLGKKIFFVNDFFPRFFVEKDENIDFIVEENKKHIKKVVSENYKKLGGDKELITIYTYRTQDVVDIRDLFAKTYEANIKFTEVFKRDNLIKGYFYIPEHIFKMKNRRYVINGIEYFMIKTNEIDGGELIF